jgi:hypothetical protein
VYLHLDLRGHVRIACRVGAELAVKLRDRHADPFAVGRDEGVRRAARGARVWFDRYPAGPQRGRVDVIGRGAGRLLGDVRGPRLGHDHLAAVDHQDQQRQRDEGEDHQPQRHRTPVGALAGGPG